ncbi:MAG TPA: hypothetical protein VFN61_13880 [Acidimicrobiales bacterium]|nr:hypothetical protein [Acidimicrobiales bacterium]
MSGHNGGPWYAASVGLGRRCRLFDRFALVFLPAGGWVPLGAGEVELTGADVPVVLVGLGPMAFGPLDEPPQAASTRASATLSAPTSAPARDDLPVACTCRLVPIAVRNPTRVDRRLRAALVGWQDRVRP